jgi:hypothetical protein
LHPAAPPCGAGGNALLTSANFCCNSIICPCSASRVVPTLAVHRPSLMCRFRFVACVNSCLHAPHAIGWFWLPSFTHGRFRAKCFRKFCAHANSFSHFPHFDILCIDLFGSLICIYGSRVCIIAYCFTVPFSAFRPLSPIYGSDPDLYPPPPSAFLFLRTGRLLFHPPPFLLCAPANFLLLGCGPLAPLTLSTLSRVGSTHRFTELGERARSLFATPLSRVGSARLSMCPLLFL